MPDNLPPSEYGGKTRRNGIQNHPHLPTASEKLSLIYRTGDDSGLSNADSGEAFTGLSKFDIQLDRKLRSGAMNKGEIWEEMLQTPEPQSNAETS